jgi:hypothetical protein
MDPKALIDNGRLRYSCRCGWVDTGHADPKTVRPGIGPGYLWSQIQTGAGQKTKFSGPGFKVRYRQDAVIKLWKFKTFPGVTGEYVVQANLNLHDKESVALAIFEEVSSVFEMVQGLAFWSGSNFSIEDLVSNLISFYVSVRPGTDYLKLCQVLGKQESLDLLDRYPNTFSSKNRDFRPVYFDSDACGCSGPFPPELQLIKPAKKGKLFRDWTELDDYGWEGYRERSKYYD